MASGASLPLLAATATAGQNPTPVDTDIPPSTASSTHLSQERAVALSRPGPYNPAAALSPKLVKRILDLEFVEMAELTTDTWEEPSPSDSSSAIRRPSRRVPVTDINIWLECFARMAAVLCTRFPEKAPELWAYQSTIVRAAKNFEGAIWVAYDRQFRKEALGTKSLDWSVSNHRLYSDAFTGRAKAVVRCQHCLSDTHSSQQCPANPNPIPVLYMPDTSRYYHNTVVPPSWYMPPSPTKNPMVCRNYNDNRCTYPKCHYIHQCLDCGHPHPYALCPRNPASHTFSAAGNRPRSPLRLGRPPPRRPAQRPFSQ